MTNLTARPVPNDAFCVRRLGDETVLLAENGAAIHALDEVGTFIWEAMDGERTLAQILARVCDDFAVERDVAAADLLAFVNDLVAKDIVRLEESHS